MSDRSTSEGHDGGTPEPNWKRRARLARIFGDELPETTRDERDEPGDRSSGSRSNDARLRADVPPHHGS